MSEPKAEKSRREEQERERLVGILGSINYPVEPKAVSTHYFTTYEFIGKKDGEGSKSRSRPDGLITKTRDELDNETMKLEGMKQLLGDTNEEEETGK